jgi:cyclophilin family peptidyl-prolyl cis-trans isomerase
MVGVIALMVVLSAAVVFWPPNLGRPTVVKVETDRGDITLNIYGKVMPKTVANFVRLVEAGFYSNQTFHRVEDWVVQAGIPPADAPAPETVEFEAFRQLKHVRGAVGMARLATDVNSASTQFYITRKAAHQIDGSYAVFGVVTQGLDVLDKIEANDKIKQVTIVSRGD